MKCCNMNVMKSKRTFFLKEDGKKKERKKEKRSYWNFWSRQAIKGVWLTGDKALTSHSKDASIGLRDFGVVQLSVNVNFPSIQLKKKLPSILQKNQNDLMSKDGATC